MMGHLLLGSTSLLKGWNGKVDPCSAKGSQKLYGQSLAYQMMSRVT